MSGISSEKPQTSLKTAECGSCYIAIYFKGYHSGTIIGCAPRDPCYIKAISTSRLGINTAIISNTNPLTVGEAGEITGGLISSARLQRKPFPRESRRVCSTQLSCVSCNEKEPPCVQLCWPCQRILFSTCQYPSWASLQPLQERFFEFYDIVK